MRRILNEAARMKKIAGIISEGLGEFSDAPKVQKAAQAISKLRQFPSFGYAELYRVITAAMLSPEEFTAAADMAGLEYETEILDNNGNAEFSIADDNYKDFRKPITFVGGKLERIDLRVREGADMAKSDEITMEGEEVNEGTSYGANLARANDENVEKLIPVITPHVESALKSALPKIEAELKKIDPDEKMSTRDISTALGSIMYKMLG